MSILKFLYAKSIYVQIQNSYTKACVYLHYITETMMALLGSLHSKSNQYFMGRNKHGRYSK